MNDLKWTSLFCLKLGVAPIFLGMILGSPASTAAEFNKEEHKIKITEDKAQRLAQAKELMGRYYKHSVVRFGEEVPHVRNYLEQQVEAALPKKYKKDAGQMTKVIFAESKKHGFDPLFILAVMTNESHVGPDTIGRYGEIGLMQIKPDTAEWISNRYHLNYDGPKSLHSIKTNIEIGTAYLDYLREKFDKHSRLYLSAYNMGPGNVRNARSRDIWPKDYVIRVMDYYVKFYAELTEHGTRKPAQKVELTAMADRPATTATSGHSRTPQSIEEDMFLHFDPIAEN